MPKTILNDEQIRETAYLFWLDDGQPNGRDEEHWFRAVDALTKPTPKAKAPKRAAAKPRTAKPAAKAAAKPAAKRAAKPKAKTAKTP